MRLAGELTFLTICSSFSMRLPRLEHHVLVFRHGLPQIEQLTPQHIARRQGRDETVERFERTRRWARSGEIERFFVHSQCGLGMIRIARG